MSETQQIKGVITHILPIQTGTSKDGKEWQKLDFVIETQDSQYPKSVSFTLFGEKTKLIDGIGTGQIVDVSYNLKSRENDGRWFTNVNAWKVIAEAPAQQASYPPTQQADTTEAPGGSQAPTDDLPF